MSAPRRIAPAARAGARGRARGWMLVGIALAALAVAAVFVLRAQDPPPGPLKTVRLQSNAYPLSALLYVAIHRRLFERHGIQPVLEEVDTGRQATINLLAGRTDLAAAADIVVAFHALADNPVVVVGSLGEAHGGHGVLARRDRGIIRIDDLRGKRVAVALGTSGHYYLYRVLLRAGIAVDELTLVDAPPVQQIAMLGAGDVDALATWDPFLHEAMATLGDNAMPVDSPAPARLTWNLVVTREYLAREPQAIEAVLRALGDAAAFVRREPEAAARIVAARLRLPKAMFAETWPSYYPELTLRQSLIVTLEAIARWAISSGQAPFDREVPNFLEYVDPLPLGRANPHAIGLFQ